LDITTNTDDLTKVDRTSRSTLGSRRHLKVDDANQVAKYFLGGGPLKGHSHFVRASNCDSNNDENNVVGMSNPTDENDAVLSENEENANANSSDSIVDAPHIPGLYSAPGTAPIVQPFSLLHPPLNTLPPVIPHIPVRGSLLHSLVHGLLQAHSQIHQAFSPTLPLHHLADTPLVGSPKPLLHHRKAKVNFVNDLAYSHGQYIPLLGASPTRFNSKSPVTHMIHPDYIPHLQPTGYILKYVPHSRESLSPVVGSPQQSSDCINDNSDTEQNLGSVDNEDDTDVTQ
ncbi:PREDICTED: uncharacterized protein LOC107186753, partial [Dufourea novaeangliae]